MKLLFASDSFKGSLSSEKTVDLLTRAAREVFGECETSGVPVADGGEGTVDAVIAAENGEKIAIAVHGPLMEETTAEYGVFGGDKAVIEMAAASGLPMVPEDLRNPLNTTTYGTGELILDALPCPSPSAAPPPTTGAWAARGLSACASWTRKAMSWRASAGISPVW